jgi:beta-N-acetylhexosaminidase
MSAGLGALFVDIQGLELTAEEREYLCHPAVGGVILFARNYQDPKQLSALTAAIHALRKPPLLIAVDQEGGRVQRFRNEGFTALPSASQLGDFVLAVGDSTVVEQSAWLLAAELLACGVDFTFAPVLDVDYGLSAVIGSRAFAGDPKHVADLGLRFAAGLAKAGMRSCAKHFPGHGGVVPDSHLELPVDRRLHLDADILPFRLGSQTYAAVMLSHVLYQEFDDKYVASFSPFWRQTLRQDLGFRGVIFSDDLSMAATACYGSPAARCLLSLQQACDLVLLCNDPKNAVLAIETLGSAFSGQEKIQILRPTPSGAPDLATLQTSAAWQSAYADVQRVLSQVNS